MPFDWQTGICLVCVAAAAIVLARRSWRVIRGEADSCGGCAETCGEPVSEEAEQLVPEERISLLYEDTSSREPEVQKEK